MENWEFYGNWSNEVLLLGLSISRVAVAFLILPLFSSQLIPALIRNAIFVSLALIAIIIQPTVEVQALSSIEWMKLFAKEAFIGLVIGVFFGVYLWAFEAAGVIIDTQVGSSMAMVFDPLSGHEVTLIGEFLGLLTNFLFLAAGGLMLLTGAILESYAIYPLSEPVTGLRALTVKLFEQEFGNFFTLTLMLASPIVVVIFAIDLCMGLVNRYAQQLNVLFLSTSLKSLAALVLLIMLLPFLVDMMHQQIAEHSGDMQNYLTRVIGK